MKRKVSTCPSVRVAAACQPDASSPVSSYFTYFPGDATGLDAAGSGSQVMESGAVTVPPNRFGWSAVADRNSIAPYGPRCTGTRVPPASSVIVPVAGSHCSLTPRPQKRIAPSQAASLSLIAK